MASIKGDNTVVVLRGLSSTVLKIYAALAASRPTRRYKNSSTFTTNLFSTFSTAFISSTPLLFALSSVELITNFYSLPIFLSFIFLPSCFLNGGKVSDLHSVPRSQNFSVLHSRHIFNSSQPHHLLSIHNILISADSSCFCACGMIVCFYRVALFPRLRQDSLFLPTCHRSARHDTFVPPRCSSFVAPRYFVFTALPIF